MNKAMYIEMKNSHNGFSLVEVIVSLLVSSFIIVAIGGLLTIGTRVYKSSSAETELQKESQIAMNLINDIMIKAISYEYIIVSADIEVLLITTDREKLTDPLVSNNYYAIILDKINQRLLLQRATNLDFIGEAKDWAILQANNEVVSTTPSLLSRYVTSLIVNPDKSSISKKETVQVTINLKLNDREYSTFITMKLRNS